MADTQETVADIIVAMRNYSNDCNDGYHTDYGVVCEDMRDFADRFDAAHKREITILLGALAEVVASIEVRFPVIEYALDRKPYLDAKKILEQYKENPPSPPLQTKTTQEDNQ